MTNFVVATVKPWNVAAFRRNVPRMAGSWHLITDPEQLDVVRLADLSPRFVFFPHWSWKVPAEILDRFECVCFHMADVPYGRGGSPLQNLILRGHRDTKLSALRMVEAFDAGPVYLKRDLSLSGAAHEIYARAAELAYEMIEEIVARQPSPVSQSGEAVTFRRRRPEESELPAAGDIDGLYDFIRMLDAETYPRAFVHYGDWRLEFADASRDLAGVTATVRIVPRGSKG